MRKNFHVTCVFCIIGMKKGGVGVGVTLIGNIQQNLLCSLDFQL